MDRADTVVGTRVRYIGEGLPAYTGRTGEVEGHSESGFIFVRLDRTDGIATRGALVAMMAHNLEPEEATDASD